ncbi:hypothetical protein [Enterococcus sp. CSURQ0835]|uniref:hypothetical protein n=1 Tax=Enterococcus sp. CSURQ0835 TaxID=2681394 RepID=UPI00135C5BD4|nr:hypothetical protein [Enterococcus sp. CSURQ0835]
MKNKRDIFLKSISICLIIGGICLICGYILNGATLTTVSEQEATPWYQVVHIYGADK